MKQRGGLGARAAPGSRHRFPGLSLGACGSKLPA